MFYCLSEPLHTHTCTVTPPMPTPPQVKQIPFKSGPAAAWQGVRRGDCDRGAPWVCVCASVVRVCVNEEVNDGHSNPSVEKVLSTSMLSEASNHEVF